MHYTAIEYGRAFFKNYAAAEKQDRIIVEIGSQDVNGSLRQIAPLESKYIGLDFEKGKGVDIVLTDAYKFPLPDNYADVVVTSSCFEHSQFFWLTFTEALRILKPDGVLYINAPSNGQYHTYPTDNWRFYPDASLALSNYANTLGGNTAVLESFIGKQESINNWNDFIAVIIKDKSYVSLYPNRIYKNLSANLAPTNIWAYGNSEVINKSELTEDQITVTTLSKQKGGYWFTLEIANYSLLAILITTFAIAIARRIRRNNLPS